MQRAVESRKLHHRVVLETPSPHAETRLGGLSGKFVGRDGSGVQVHLFLFGPG